MMIVHVQVGKSYCTNKHTTIKYSKPEKKKETFKYDVMNSVQQ
jgi:hypothetical protein